MFILYDYGRSVFLYLFYFSSSIKRVNQRVWKCRSGLTPVSFKKKKKGRKRKKSHLNSAYLFFYGYNVSLPFRLFNQCPLKSLCKLDSRGSCATRILYSACLTQVHGNGGQGTGVAQLRRKGLGEPKHQNSINSIQLCKMKRILEVGHTVMWMYLTLLNCTLKNGTGDKIYVIPILHNF